MSPEQHRRAKAVFLRACEVTPEERATFLDGACDGDEELRRHVDALLTYRREPAGGDGDRTEPAGRLAAGQLVDGKYAVEARLGAGGMGEVYRARQLSLDRTVVVKVLLSDPRPNALRRFEREARALARLNHPNVVTVYDLGASSGVGTYLVMEYVDGRTLRDEARRAGALPVAAAVELMRQVCAGAVAAHAAGVIHRDLKPENVLIEGDGDRMTAKVADFGIARLVEPAGPEADSLTGTGAVMGTAHYMSPEQCRGEDADARSDVYALGCMLFELLTGRPPFTAASVLGVLEKHRSEAPTALADLRPGVPAALGRVVTRALEKARDRRWQSAAELGDALARVARGEEVADAAATEPFPTATPTNLPSPLTRCIGRDREIAELSALLDDDAVRLVTITGTGGIGKTRLAVETGHALVPSFPDGVFQVDLAALADGELLAQRIAHVFGVTESAGGSVAEKLASFLRDKRMLIVLDNFEHLLSGAPLVARLLEAAPRLKALVTSQAPLRLRGEREYALETLAVPFPDSLATLEAVERSPAVKLFAERARQEKPSFEVTDENAWAVAEVCRRVDGLPLAIELAAVRVKLLTPATILDRLERQLALLTGGARDLPERQRTMRAAVAWSYELLGESERSLLRALAVFSGGCTLDAAEVVCGEGGADVLDALGSLVDKSLLRRRETEGEARFGMLAVVREYALERLETRGEADAARMRHARYFRDLALEVDPRAIGDDASWIAQFGREHENFASALAVLLEREPHEGVRLAVACRRYWPLFGRLSEGIGWTDRALASGGAGPAERAALVAGLGLLEAMRGNYEVGVGHARDAVATARALDDGRALLDALNCGIMSLLSRPGNHSEARAYLEEAIDLARAFENRNYTASLLANLSATMLLEGDRERGRAYAEEALGLTTMSLTRATCLLNLGDMSLEDGDLAGASARLREGLVTICGYGDRARAAFALESLAEIALIQDRPEKAARIAGAVEMIYETREGGRSYLPSDSWERTLAKMGQALEPPELERERRRGRAMGFDAAVAEALRDD